MSALSVALLVPVAALFIYALIKKVNVYKAFAAGAADALPQLINVLPYLAAMLTAIEALRSSGVLSYLIGLLRPAALRVGLDPELLPILLLRPFSGSATLAVLKDTLTNVGADSAAGRAASVVVGSTETVFYTVALYFGSVGVTKTRQAIPAALISGAVGVIVGLLLV